ncbi:MAG: hypothetical protein AB7P52_02315 [Alphaproteobacteria bacterium]
MLDRAKIPVLAKRTGFGALLWVAVVLGLYGAHAQGKTAAAADPSPCALLNADEVEEVLGGPLAGPPFRAGGAIPAENGEACRYETADYRSIDLRVEWNDGGTTFGAMGMLGDVVDEGGLKGVLKLSDGTILTGAWDEARVFMCCEFHALRGEQLVTVDISGSRATIAQAAALADAALRRIEAPLDVDDAASIGAAEARMAERPPLRPVCELVTRAEAEAIVGATLSAEPAGNDGSCTYVWVSPADNIDYEFELRTTWRRGFSEMRNTLAAIGQSMAMFEEQGLAFDAEQTSDGPLFDEFATNLIGTMAVRKDVFLSIESGPFMTELSTAFIKAAASKL